MKSRIEIKLEIEKFINEELWVYVVVLYSVAFCSWIFDRWIEGIMIVISHNEIRKAFDKQFHFNKTAYCLILTLSLIWFAIPISLPLASSLLSSIPISFIICFIGFIAQDRVDLISQVKDLDKYATKLVMELAKKNTKDIYAMTEEELYEHCRNCGLDEEDCKIAYFIVIERLKGKELYDALPYGEATIKRKRLKIMAKIKKEHPDITKIEHF